MVTRVFLHCDSFDWSSLIDLIDWESFRSFLYLHSDADPVRAEMLRFTAAAIGVAPSILDHLMSFGFFADLLQYTGDFSCTSRELSLAVLAAAIRLVPADQRRFFLDAGALPVLLLALEESDPDSARSALVVDVTLAAVRDLWGACDAAGIAAQFLAEFAEHRGFQVLADLEVFQEQANQLADSLPDPRE
jgi:hypothetical protein